MPPKPRGGKREGAGRPVLSPTREARVEPRWRVAPSAISRVQAEAARLGVSPSELVERWALSLPPAS